ncbi:GNAT family N-acetyltransferase [Gottfriedia sp. OAE603]|uniref:GNAT family N-acetyltransferase n=1 Tax=Gottfriedia sp. OAE603 TaxID=2663872 RepID=UPI003490B6E3
MDNILKIETINSESFKILNGEPEYINIEETENINEKNLVNELKTIVDQSLNKEVRRIGVFINKSSEHYSSCSKLLLELGFELYTSKVEVLRLLQDISRTNYYKWHSIADTKLSEDEFKMLWKQCMAGSENRTSSFSIDEHLNSVKSLLGPNWKKSCIAFYEENKPIGISIPHIEPGTLDEGRLFYFGLLPAERGKGRSYQFHYQSLWILKQMGATFYKGSTHETNIKMQNVFFKNNCSIKSRTESYYKYLK